MKNVNFTNTTMWMLPLYGLPKKVWDEAGFVNAYVINEDKDYGIPSVFAVFRSHVDLAENLDDLITMLDSVVIEQYGYNKKVIILSLEVPVAFEEDYELIMQSKYSQLSDEYRAMVSDKVEGEKGKKTGGKRLQLVVIEKDEAVKSFLEKAFDLDLDHADEYWERFDITKETLTQQILNRL